MKFFIFSLFMGILLLVKPAIVSAIPPTPLVCSPLTYSYF